MSTSKTFPLRQIASRVKTTFAELDYAQRRLWEIRTEMPAPGRQQPRKRNGSREGLRSLSGAASS